MSGDLPDVAETMTRLGLRGKRVALLVEVNLDPVPGWGNTADDFRAGIQRLLDDSIGHYNPTVTVHEGEVTA